MNRNLVEIALQELGAEDRALLELSVVRGVSDEDIADLLKVDIARVLIRREEALGRVSALVDQDPEEVLRTMRGLPDARWRTETDGRQPAAGSPPEEAPGPDPDPERDPEPEAAAPAKPAAADPWPEADRGRFMLVLLVGLAITLVVAVFLALTGDENDPVPAAEPPAETRAAQGAFQPVARSGGKGRAGIVSSGGQPRLAIAVQGLPTPSRGGYVIWLYNSVTDARPVAGASGGRFDLRARLPGDYRRYRFIDVSREPADGNRNHSGQSVLRVPVGRLR